MEKGSENKELILNTAIKLFAAKGFDGVGVQEICVESKITKPTLYYYFSSKTGLLSAIIEKKGNILLEELQSASEYKRDFVASLINILKKIIEFARHNPDFFRLHCALSSSSFDSVAGKIYEPFSEKMKKLFEDFFASSCNEFGNMRGKELLFSRIFQQTCQAVALDVIQNRLEKSDQMIFSVVHSFVYGVAAG